MKNLKGLIAVLATLTAFGPLLAGQARAQDGVQPRATGESSRSVFIDPQDGKVDLSEWLLEHKGFLPVPLIITEPAVGYGAGLAALFFRQSMSEAVEQSRTSGHVTPPDIYALAAAATENGTKLIGGGAMLTFFEDRWRYRGFVGQTDLHLDFYGVGGALGKDMKIGYQLDGQVSSQQVLRRLAESDNFVGLRWIFLDLSSNFNPASRPPQALSQRSSGLGISFEHDSRDNFFTPSRGIKAALDTLFYSPDIGSDSRFRTLRAYAFGYAPVSKAVVLAGRLDRRAARGDAPFYQLPYIDLRGVPVARYQDNDVAVAEMEARWTVADRWGLIAFAGAGRAWGIDRGFSDAPTKAAKGAGFRYQIARVLGMWAGLDYAWGPDRERAVYLQLGTAWR